MSHILLNGIGGAVGGTGGTSDHGSLSGLYDDDHPQYRLTATTIYFSEIGSTGHTHDDYSLTSHTHSYSASTPQEEFNAHTGYTSIHFTEASIDHGNILGLFDDDHPRYSQSSHTHTEYTTDTEFDVHSGDSTIHFTIGSIPFSGISNTGHTHEYSALTSTAHTHSDYSLTGHAHPFSAITTTGHTHVETDITDLGDYAERSYFESHTGTSNVHFTESSIDHGNINGLYDDDHPQYRLTATTIDFSEISNTGHTHDDYSSSAHTHNPSGGTILSGGAIDGQTMIWRDSIDAWSGETIAAGSASHSGLTDMPDTDGTNIDHDVRYIPIFSGDTPTIPTPYSGMMWYDTSTGSTVEQHKTSTTKIVYISAPEAGDEYPIMAVPFNCTITRVTHKTDTGTVDFNLNERVETTPEIFGTDIWSVDEQASSTMSASTDFNNATIDQTDWIYFSASTVASSPTKLWISVSYTED